MLKEKICFVEHFKAAKEEEEEEGVLIISTWKSGSAKGEIYVFDLDRKVSFLMPIQLEQRVVATKALHRKDRILLVVISEDNHLWSVEMEPFHKPLLQITITSSVNEYIPNASMESLMVLEACMIDNEQVVIFVGRSSGKFELYKLSSDLQVMSSEEIKEQIMNCGACVKIEFIKMSWGLLLVGGTEKGVIVWKLCNEQFMKLKIISNEEKMDFKLQRMDDKSCRLWLMTCSRLQIMEVKSSAVSECKWECPLEAESFLALDSIGSCLQLWMLGKVSLSSIRIPESKQFSISAPAISAVWFECKPENFPYLAEVSEGIEKQRRVFGLFFDRLLTVMGLKESISSYPPASFNDLSALVKQIMAVDSDDLKKNCLIYYLIRDRSHSSNQHEMFAQRTAIPSNYKHLIDAYWSLDRLDLHGAFKNFLFPNVIPDWPDDILKIFMDAELFELAYKWINLFQCSTVMEFAVLKRVDLQQAVQFQLKHAPSMWNALITSFSNEKERNDCLLYAAKFDKKQEDELLCALGNDFWFKYLFSRSRFEEALQHGMEKSLDKDNSFSLEQLKKVFSISSSTSVDVKTPLSASRKIREEGIGSALSNKSPLMRTPSSAADRSFSTALSSCDSRSSSLKSQSPFSDNSPAVMKRKGKGTPFYRKTYTYSDEDDEEEDEDSEYSSSIQSSPAKQVRTAGDSVFSDIFNVSKDPLFSKVITPVQSRYQPSSSSTFCFSNLKGLASAAKKPVLATPSRLSIMTLASSPEEEESESSNNVSMLEPIESPVIKEMKRVRRKASTPSSPAVKRKAVSLISAAPSAEESEHKRYNLRRRSSVQPIPSSTPDIKVHSRRKTPMKKNEK